MELFGDRSRYKRLVRKLKYLTITRLDIPYAVSMVSQFMEALRTAQCHTIFEETPGRGILCRKIGHLRIEEFTDVDWTRSPSE